MYQIRTFYSITLLNVPLLIPLIDCNKSIMVEVDIY